MRKIINDPAYAGYFLDFKSGGYFPNGTYHVPQCDTNWHPPRCTHLYHDQEQTPGFPHGDGSCPGPCDCGGVPCGEYLFAHAGQNKSQLSDWILGDILGPTALGNPNISGFYLDDEWYNTSTFGPNSCSGSSVGGPTEEDMHCLEDMGVADVDFTTATTDAWCATRQRIEASVLANEGWIWQMFVNFKTPDKASCASTLRQQCSAGVSSTYYNSTIYHALTFDRGSPSNLTNFNQDLAVFLLLRGEYAFLGYGWIGCGAHYAFPDALKGNYGQPLNLCSETAPNSGVFTREWSNAKISMDCNTYVGTVTQQG